MSAGPLNSNSNSNRSGASSPLNLVWNDVDDPFGLDFSIPDSAFPESAESASTLDSELAKFSSEVSTMGTHEEKSRLDKCVKDAPVRKKKSATQTKGRRTRAKKPSGKPKRPLTAKMCFFEEIKAKEQRERGTIDYQDLRRIVEETWSNMGAYKRRRYEKQAADDMNRFREEMKNFTKMKGKKVSACTYPRSQSPACPSPSPEPTPVTTNIKSNQRLLDDLGQGQKTLQLIAGSSSSCIYNEKDAQIVMPTGYHRTIESEVVPRRNSDFSCQKEPVRLPVGGIPTSPHQLVRSRSNISPSDGCNIEYPCLDDRRLQTAPTFPTLGRHQPHPPQEGADYLQAPRPRTEQAPPALMRPKMEIELCGPDGVTRKYILHYRCIAMKRSDVPAFMESLTPGAHSGAPRDVPYPGGYDQPPYSHV